ncbi:hypothetical protein [Mycolicibacterium fluoranthenivorans]|uniref:Uncharacterized protein n=1 Tax=Mycolicibacterium fluoranthenivorans TaxID=258505 RepID=A0A7X5U455_9MYCO|nr:hypothetical protein [Mycolicibacterium fluoranthenivorans]MCV7358509.1 hypothetical protein [Mycolicibacterium fluoranthenivorans]NIH98086.1 hypothetical protein [Mycolicibacterium fluoranthenivorans]
MAIGRGVDLDIIEVKREGQPLTGDGGESVILPNRVLLNGLPVLVPSESPIYISAGDTTAVTATLKVFVNRLSIHAEHPVVDDVDPPLYEQLCGETDCNPIQLSRIIFAASCLRSAW